ncbi:MAG: hypothetical protein D6785_03675, partial [Planctomycetota bacterium]
GIITVTGVLLFCILAVLAVFFGPKNGGKMKSWQSEENQKELAEVLKPEFKLEKGDINTSGTIVLVLILLVSFAIYYFANWKALADVWYVR